MQKSKKERTRVCHLRHFLKLFFPYDKTGKTELGFDGYDEIWDMQKHKKRHLSGFGEVKIILESLQRIPFDY